MASLASVSTGFDRTHVMFPEREREKDRVTFTWLSFLVAADSFHALRFPGWK